MTCTSATSTNACSAESEWAPSTPTSTTVGRGSARSAIASAAPASGVAAEMSPVPAGSSREPEYGRKVAGEVGHACGPDPSEHERGGRGNDRGSRATLGRPEANQHEKRLPRAGRARGAHAGNTGKAFGKALEP